MSPAGNKRTVFSFVALSLVWGASFLCIKLGLVGLSPGQVALGRVLLGAITLAVVMLVTSRRWPAGRGFWLRMIMPAAMLTSIPWLLIAWGEQHVASSAASVINATTPIMTLLLTPLILPSEKLSRFQIGGLFIGLMGVVILVGPWRLFSEQGGSAPLLGTLACLAATVCYGVGSLGMRRFISGAGYDPITVAATQLAVAAGVSLLLAPLTARGSISLEPVVIGAMLTLGVLGSGVAYIWFNIILSDWGASRTVTVTYVAPVVGVALGVLVLGEAISANQLLGGLVVITGVIISQGVRLSGRASPAAFPSSK